MNFEIVDREGNEFTSFELDSNPFKVGEKLHINITNSDPSFWTKTPMSKQLKIVDIEHFSRQMYSSNGKYYLYFTVSVTVEEVNED